MDFSIAGRYARQLSFLDTQVSQLTKEQDDKPSEISPISDVSFHHAPRDKGNRPNGKGDVGGTFEAESRQPFFTKNEKRTDLEYTENELGRRAIARTLSDTGDEKQIQQDEFEIIEHENGNYTVVLPGVTDLSNPDFGLNSDNHTVRDTDQFAIDSSRSSNVDDNRYAELVRDYVLNNVPDGANVMIVGHSFGADTALDLASDPVFNNPDTGVNVTHVVAAAYYSQPQLSDVQEHTEVLVLQNTLDAAVITEAAAYETLDATKDVFGTVGQVIDTSIDAAELALDTVRGDGAGVVNNDISQSLIDSYVGEVTQFSDNIAVARFAGGTEGAGHKQANYIDFVNGSEGTATNSTVQEFYTSVAEAGYAESGESFAIDVSVPNGGELPANIPLTSLDTRFWEQIPGHGIIENVARESIDNASDAFEGVRDVIEVARDLNDIANDSRDAIISETRDLAEAAKDKVIDLPSKTTDTVTNLWERFT